MNAVYRKTLAAIFAKPAKAEVRWDSSEVLFVALGAEISEGRALGFAFFLTARKPCFIARIHSR